tara:strand:+ start:633 stop:1094 length:462 start_codon:yes stop_codon:yes gene_type:complete
MGKVFNCLIGLVLMAVEDVRNLYDQECLNILDAMGVWDPVGSMIELRKKGEKGGIRRTAEIVEMRESLVYWLKNGSFRKVDGVNPKGLEPSFSEIAGLAGYSAHGAAMNAFSNYLKKRKEVPDDIYEPWLDSRLDEDEWEMFKIEQDIEKYGC